MAKSVSRYLKNKKRVPVAIKPEGGEGGKALMARPLREELVFAASLSMQVWQLRLRRCRQKLISIPTTNDLSVQKSKRSAAWSRQGFSESTVYKYILFVLFRPCSFKVINPKTV